jgi:heme A synthase
MRCVNPWLHRYALFLAAFALAVVISGAFVTSTEIAARQSQYPVSREINEALHRVLAIALTFFTLGAGIWTSFAATPGWLRALAWTALASLAIASIVGWPAPPLSPALGIVHALLAHFFLSVIVVIAVVTSPGWNRETELAGEYGLSSLRPLAVATPPVVFLQIALGTAYRHEVTGVMPHMAGAMVVALMTLIVSAVVLHNFLGPAPMRRAAAMLISMVLAQVCLGIAAFLMLVLNAAGTFAFVLATVGHVSIGAATLAASVVMAMQVWRSVPPKARLPATREPI